MLYTPVRKVAIVHLYVRCQRLLLVVAILFPGCCCCDAVNTSPSLLDLYSVYISRIYSRGSTAAMMRLCTALILMLALYQVDSSDRLKVFGNLHETSSLPCPQTCSGLLTWTTFQRRDDVLVNCTRDSCWSKDGFSLPLEQFLSGDSTLTVLRADYSLRGLYMATCDSETLCEVVFTLSREPIDVLLPLTDHVKVDFTPSDAAQPPNQEICIVDKDKIHCSPDYKERSSSSTLFRLQMEVSLTAGSTQFGIK
ncbi:uncharacterized protein Hap1MRO34_023539 [Clarias gariepinus]|uniref:uncharacterized protein LOC128509707 n=1 Tax=Clarias gariepinus TaxID=13013 RepID=UPI00234D97EA|nr:uncharacterized protein LOC128509707 [Clarias gariepinus]